MQLKFTACQPSVPDPALVGNSSSFSLTYQTLTCCTWLVKVRRDYNFIQIVISEQFIQQGDQLCVIPSPFPLLLDWTDLPGEGNPESGWIWSQWPEMKSAGSWKWSRIHPVCSAAIDWCYESRGSLPGDKYPLHSYLFTQSQDDAHETIKCKMMGKTKTGNVSQWCSAVSEHSIYKTWHPLPLVEGKRWFINWCQTISPVHLIHISLVNTKLIN